VRASLAHDASMLSWTVAEKHAPKVHVSVGDIAVDKMAIL